MSTPASPPLNVLPPPPGGVNPYAYWAQVVYSTLFRPPDDPNGFRARLIVLLVLLSFLVFGGFASLALTVVDYRRRGKEFFLWRRVQRERGKYIVGNQQLLEPILTIVSGSIFLSHTIVDWRWAFGHGSYAVVAPIRLVTWTVLFLQLWIVSWASLQSFIITAGDNQRIMRWVIPLVANTIFIGLGLALTILLLFSLIYASVMSKKLWRSYSEFGQVVYACIPVWPAAVDMASQNALATVWSQFFSRARSTLSAMSFTVIVFAASSAVTVLINLGGIALLVIVRRQIKSNLSNFVGAGTRPEYQLPNLATGGNPTSRTARTHEIELEETSNDSSTSRDSHRAGVGGLVLAVTPATPVLESQEQRCSLSPSAGDASLPGSRRSSLGKHAGGETTSTGGMSMMSGTGESGRKKSRPPSRSAVRKMAGNEAGGVAAAQARNLQQLHRAESDLSITSCSSISTALAFMALSSWVYVILPEASQVSWAEAEIAIFLGSWLYAIIHSLALSAHFWISWRNLAPKPPAVLPQYLILSPGVVFERSGRRKGGSSVEDGLGGRPP
ncbi:hypothetical protein JCM8547_009324 [Rhodosporidiobolus lusitaniae]